MNTSSHLFFDLDRTLWDFEKNSQQALRILYEDLGLKSNAVSIPFKIAFNTLLMKKIITKL